MTRLLFVHAHPDDESLWTGLAIAHHARLGDEVHVLTCTLGEEGEVIPSDLAHLELPAGRPRDPEAPDPLADVRRAELRAAVAELGVTSSVVLGEQGGPERSYRDSGMAGTPSAAHPRAFARAPLSETGALIAAHLDRLAIEVVVTYDEHGGYGHPDHIQTHRATREAVRTCSSAPRMYAAVTPDSWAREDRAWLAQHVREPGVLVPAQSDAYPPSVVADELVTDSVQDAQAGAMQAAALRRHRTQVMVHDGWFTLSNRVAARLSGREGYARVDPETGALVAPQHSGEGRSERGRRDE
ncbi:PIG-L family deacetylase [Leekyejoonella antrihumi]|uniref:1D-myo-inositol 2-acetamido-2-deoxy-alpha-D-glucopyranoside deacetylase n=1 Tax=Leekyejoonella antrihumi TaxID=1660198 RepID=A0A563DWH6_9MICO|nr:PIG-L family deacetylase [Leekyejoonella antrihumi]TWP34566.1 1D-myo-inositol 2-acetamido-2-deoxy-alpha-D-glucopyranoside deacetylase [Leekyejoonella antrihumi]